MITGGLGYIGSHTVVELINETFNVVIIDNLSNAEIFILDRIEKITGIRPVLYKKNLCDVATVKEIFSKHATDVVIHFAAFKSVSESVRKPLKYFQNNLGSLLNVIAVMQENNLQNLIFSSSATVYGQPEILPATEQTPFQKALSAYASTKQIGEEILKKMAYAGIIQNISLRYFNPVGAHVSALIDELPIGIPNNLFPYITQTGIGKLKKVTVFGTDYNTADGSCIRDYIHVVDLAKALVQACKKLLSQKNIAAYEVYYIGTGNGTSVLQIINAFETFTEKKLNYVNGDRRQGDALEI